MELNNKEFPKFKYYLDPIKTGDIKRELAVCSVCRGITEYVYDGVFYSMKEVDVICPWCISDGKAAKKFKGQFINPENCERADKEEYTDELIHKTPSYFAWKKEKWPVHCGDYCTFVDYVGWDEIKDIEIELSSDINKLSEDMGMPVDTFKRSMVNDSSHQGYLFQCLHCGKHRLYSDKD